MNPLFERLEKIKLSNPKTYYSTHFFTSWSFEFLLALRHPKMFPELKHCAINQLEMMEPLFNLFGLESSFVKLPKDGIRFEGHSHTSNFSQDAKCDSHDVIDYLFEKEIDIWAPTDHNNPYLFDQIVSEEIKLKDIYELSNVNPDGRSLVIERKSDEKKLVVIRAMEYYTRRGEIGIYGYSGHLPNEGIHLFGNPPEKNIPLGEAIGLGIEGDGLIVGNHLYANDGIGWVDEEDAMYEAMDAVNNNGRNRKFKINRGILKRPFKAIRSLKRKHTHQREYTNRFVKEAIEALEEMNLKRKFFAIEKNGSEIPPQLYCPVRAEGLAKKLDLPFLATGDAHTLSMYARSGVVFDEHDYGVMYELLGQNHADSVKALISIKKFKNYTNYATYGQIIDWIRNIN